MQEQRCAFLRNADGHSGADAAKMIENLIGEESRVEKYAFGGEFLPRRVLETRGFDVEGIIPKLPKCDIEEDSVLGTTYRIAIKSRGITHDRGTFKRSAGERVRSASNSIEGRAANDCGVCATHQVLPP